MQTLPVLEITQLRRVRRALDLPPGVDLSARRLAALVASSAVGGLAEAGVVIALVKFAVSLSGKGTTTTAGIPFSSAALFGICVGLVVVRLVLQWMAASLAARLAADTVTTVRRDLFGAFLRTKWALQDEERAGHLEELLSADARAVAGCVLAFCLALIAVMNLLVLQAASIVVNPVGALAMVTMVVLLFMLLRPFTQRARRFTLAQSLAAKEYAARISDALAMAKEIKASNAAPAITRRLDEEVINTGEAYYRAQLMMRALPAVYQTIAIALLLGLLGVLAGLGAAHADELGVLIVLLLRSISYGQAVQTAYHEADTNRAYGQKVTETLDRYDAMKEPSGGVRVSSIDWISLRSVSFAYPTGPPVLQEVSLDIAKGESIGIVGPSGVGKTTLSEILLRLREPTAGQFLVNGLDARELDREAWYKLVAFVPQEPRVVEGDVAANIRWFRDEVTDERVRAAAEDAMIAEDIESWKDGYATQLGGRLGRVSGGQRQRLCIARALAGGPGLILLDEPTSALDALSADLVRESLRSRRGQTSLVIVAHAPSILAICDRVLKLEHGQLRELPGRELASIHSAGSDRDS
jgi:ATP-binding cassette subfamily B protein